MNVHSSGALTGSFLYAIIDIAIPANATVTISQASDDVAVNIDKIIVGDGDLGLPPDIWNLPPFKAADGPYTADWKALGLAYSTPEWWRDAKFGAGRTGIRSPCPSRATGTPTACITGSADFNYPRQPLRRSIRLRLQGHLPELGDRPVGSRRA